MAKKHNSTFLKCWRMVYKNQFYFAFLVFTMIALGCTDEVVIKRLIVTPDHVCTGESIHFDWHITNVDKLEIWTSTGQRIYRTRNKRGTWDSPPVEANWSYLRLKGCQDGNCENHYWDFTIIDNPKWTCEYFHVVTADVQLCGTIIPGGVFQIIGDQPEVDYDNPVYTQDVEGKFPVYRLIRGYSYSIPRNRFSSRLRVLQMKFDRINLLNDEGGGLIDPDGMYVESTGMNSLPRSWVLKGQTLTVPTPFHPSDATWRLFYMQPQKIIVAYQFGKPEPGEKPAWDEQIIEKYPSISFFVKCDTQ